MKKMATPLTTLAALVILALIPGCAIPSLDVMPRYGTFDVDGNFGVQDSGSGSSLTADMGQAGFSKDNSVTGLRADLDFGMPRIMLSAQSSTHDGSGTLSTALTDANGNSIPINAPVDSTLDLGLYQGVVTWDFFPTDIGELGLGFGVVGVDVKGSITDTTVGGDTLDLDEFAPIPVLALRGGVELAGFEFSGMLNGMKLGVSDTDLYFLDLDLFARYAFFGGDDRMRFSLGLGYRRVDIDLESNEGGERIVLDAGFSGPYVFLQFSI